MPDENQVNTETAQEVKGKSIVDAKYRGRYKTPDWLGELIMKNTNNTKVIPAKPATEATEQVGKIGEPGFKPAQPAKDATPERTVDDGVNVDKLFALGRENGLNLDKFETQRNSHGFDGRFRMTVRNMLQTIAKQRHGLMVNGAFVAADSDWLHSKSAPTTATHNQDGTKIAKPKEAAQATESKLIKADAPKPESQPAQETTEAPKATAKPTASKKHGK